MKSFLITLAICVAIVGVTYAILRSPAMTNNQASPIPTNVPKNNYANNMLGFSINVPEGYTPNEKYEYQLAPKQTIKGVKFTIPAALAEGTNLSKDTYISVERLDGDRNCTADLFIDGSHNAESKVENGVRYSVANAQNAGAGNRYDETVYALQGDTCIAVRYVVHYTVLQNYPEGSRKEFDMNDILQRFDQIRSSLVVI